MYANAVSITSTHAKVAVITCAKKYAAALDEGPLIRDRTLSNPSI